MAASRSTSAQVVSDKSRRTWFGWGKKKERQSRAARPGAGVEQKQEESSSDEEPLEHACRALLVGGALRGGGSLAADGSSGRSPPTARADPCIML